MEFFSKNLFAIFIIPPLRGGFFLLFLEIVYNLLRDRKNMI